MRKMMVVFRREILKFFGNRMILSQQIIAPIVIVMAFAYFYRNETDITFPGVSSYQIIIAGILAAKTFYTSAELGSKFADDKESGFMREFLIAPISRSNLVFGKIMADVVASVISGTVFVIFSFIVGCKYTVLSILLIFVSTITAAIFGSSLGVFLSCRTKKKNLEMQMMLYTFPLIALCGAYVPLNLMPKWVTYISYFNPLTYLVSFNKYVVLSPLGVTLTDMQQSASVVGFVSPVMGFMIFAVAAYVLFAITASTFDRQLMK